MEKEEEVEVGKEKEDEEGSRRRRKRMRKRYEEAKTYSLTSSTAITMTQHSAIITASLINCFYHY